MFGGKADATGDDHDHDDPMTATRHRVRHHAARRRPPDAEPEHGERDDRRRDETDAAPEAVRDFLDSRHGRHFADDVASELAKAGPERLEEAIVATVARWQGWRIGRRTFRDEGIPAGLPCLTSWVAHFGILGEPVD